jgi:hypothetical protein
MPSGLSYPLLSWCLTEVGAWYMLHQTQAARDLVDALFIKPKPGAATALT